MGYFDYFRGFGLFNDFRGNLVILVFYGHFGHFLFFQGSFDYLSDFRGILVILQVFGVYFFVILEVSWLF